MFRPPSEHIYLYLFKEADLMCPCVDCIVFSCLQRRQIQFFMEASPGLLLVVRRTMQDEEVNLKGEETFEEFVQSVHGNMVVHSEELQATIVNEVVQVAHTVKVTCDTLQVSLSLESLFTSFHNRAHIQNRISSSRSWLLCFSISAKVI